MMFKLIENIRKRRLDEEERNKKEIERQKSMWKYDLEALEERMLSKPCPINDNKNCFKECVHFREGLATYITIYGDSGRFIVHYPKCKLWWEK